MDLIRASVTTVSPLTVTIDAASTPVPATLLTGAPAVGATCWLVALPNNQAPLALVQP